jgi:amino acid adenylation domain-containing protein
MVDQAARRAELSPEKRALLAQRLRRAAMRDTTIRPRPEGRTPILSSSQERLWFIEQFMPGSAAYTVAVARRVKGDLDSETLGAALTEVKRRHEALRMRFPKTAAGMPQVVIDPPAAAGLRVVDVSAAGSGSTDRVERAMIVASEAAGRPFDLAADSLLRVLLIRIADNDHVLVLTMHHIIADGWSAELIVRETLSIYDALRRGTEPDLPDLPIQFGDYAAWERERALEPDLAYWRRQLRQVPPLELTIAGARPAEQSLEGAAYNFVIDGQLADAVAELGRQHGATMYMTLMAAFQAILARHSGQSDFAVGSPTAGRPRPELENIVGCFVNMLPVRARLDGDPSFLEILQRCRDTVLDGLGHQEAPFDRIVSDLNVARDLSRSAVFQASFAFDNLQGAVGRGGQEGDSRAGLTMHALELAGRTTHFDLTLAASVEATGLNCSFVYRTDLFRPAAIERLADRMAVLLRSVVTHPELRLSRIPIMPDPERDMLLGQWSGIGVPEAVATGTLDVLVAAQAARTPDARAIDIEGRSVSHRELNARANQMARRLRRIGVSVDSRVAICLPQSLDLAVTMLAVLKAGGAYVPLDAEQPADRLRYMCADAQAAVLVTNGELKGKLSDFSGSIVDIDRERSGLDGERTAPLQSCARPAGLAYVIYTSGTTGRPKGVAVEHRSIVQYLERAREIFQVAPDSSYALLQSLSFDFSIPVFYLPLIAGGCLHLLPGKISGHDLAHAIGQLGIDYLKVTPSHLAALASDAELVRLLPRRALVLAGEAAPGPWARAIAAEGRCAVFNSYGPTETVVAATTYRAAAGAGDQPGETLPIGTPMPGTCAVVVDERMQLVPPGAAGELYVGGRLARGFLGQAALTAARFVADPFGPSGSRLYRTGDRARWLDDGTLEFLGRNDHQVKVRGYRVELGEIESVLAGLGGVRQAVVDLRGPRGREQLTAYLDMAESSPTLSDETVRASLAEVLPEYMIPRQYCRLAGFPRQAHGKVDRSALPDPAAGRPNADGSYTAPRTPEEQLIADIWTEILGIDRVGVHDNFFAIGGHSLLATRVVGGLRRAFDGAARTVGVMDMFKFPTVAELAALLAAGPDEPAQRRVLYRLTPAAEGNEPRLSFVCAPYGGANASVYRELAEALPPGYALYGIEAPGHDAALAEEQLPVDEVSGACVSEILQRVHGPVVIYGHCGPGGAVAVALAQKLEAAGRPVDALYLGGVFPFARPTGRLSGPLSRLIDLDWLQGERGHANWLRGIGADVAGLEPEQLSFMVRAMRQDGRLADAYFTGLFGSGVNSIEAPVISVVGSRDPATSLYQDRFREWGFLSASVAVAVLDEAGHFFVRHRAAELAEIITRTHRAMAAGNAGGLSRKARGPDATWWVHDVDGPGHEPAAMAGPARPGSQADGQATGMKRFTAVALGQLVSITGSTLTEFAVPLSIYLRTGSLVVFGLLAILGLLPGTLIGPLAGAIVDRHDRRLVMIAASVTAGTAEAALLLLVWSHAFQLWNLYVLTCALSLAVAFQRTAYAAAIPQIVNRRYLGHANGMVQAGSGFAQLIAPLFGAGLLAAVGLSGILLADVCSYAIAISVVLFVRFPPLVSKRGESIVSDLLGGFKFCLGNPYFRALFTFFAAENLLLSSIFILLSPLVLSFAGLSAVAAVAAVAGIGGLTAGLTMSIWGGPRLRRMTGVCILDLTVAIFAALAGIRPYLVLIMLGAFGMSFCIGLSDGIVTTIMQTKIPQRMQGRMSSINMAVSTFTAPIGFGIIAPFGARILGHVVTASGPTGGLARTVVGTGPGRPIGLFYVLSAIALAFMVLAAWKRRTIARFDLDVPDAPPDDLLGLEVIAARTQAPK